MLNNAREVRRQRLPPLRQNRALRRLRRLQPRQRKPAHRLRRKPPRIALPGGEPTRRACKPVASPKRPMLNSARLAEPCRVRPLPNLGQQPLRPRRPRAVPRQLQRMLRQPLRRKNRLPRQLLRRFRLQHSNLPPPKAVQAQRRRPGSLRTTHPQKPVVRPTLSCGLIYRRRFITSPERRATEPQSAAHICVRKKQSPLKTAHLKQKSIRDTCILPSLRWLDFRTFPLSRSRSIDNSSPAAPKIGRSRWHAAKSSTLRMALALAP